MAEPVVVRELAGGCASEIPVRAQPGARREGVAGVWNGRLKLAVRSPAEGGRANRELVRLVAELFGLRPSDVELVRGHSSRQKTLRLALPPDAVRERLLTLIPDP